MNANTRNNPKTALFNQLQLESMPIAASWEMPIQQVKMFGEPYLRTKVSSINFVKGTNIKIHQYKDGRMGFWHDPAPKRKNRPSPLFNELIAQRAKIEEIKVQFKITNNYQLLDELNKVNERINEILGEVRRATDDKRKAKKGGAVHQPLEAVLAHYKITREEWELFPDREKTRQWVRAEIEIKRNMGVNQQ